MFHIVGKLVSVASGEIIAYKIQGSTEYTAVVSEWKAKELGVEDISIAQYLDVEIIEVVEIPGNKYGIVAHASFCVDGLKSSYKEMVFDQYAYYGYVFEPNRIMPIDSLGAITRLQQIESGVYQDV